MRVALTGGGTGGHVYPALAIAEALEADGGFAPLELLFIGTRDRLEARLVPDAGRPFATVSAAPLVRSLGPALARTIVANARGVVQSLAIFHRFRPDVLIATGGYVAFPVVAALRLVRALGRSKARIALLEPNATPGLTNRLLAPLVDEVWLGVEGARAPDARTHLTGTPVRGAFLRGLSPQDGRRALALDPDKTTIVVMGGSQGARRINDAVATLAARPLPAEWQIVHVSGRDDYERVRDLERDAIARHDVRLVPYLDDPRAAYAAADLMVLRAGASTLAELAATGTPALLVPYPHATDDHQRLNAEVVARSGAATLVPDAELDGERLGREVARAVAPEPLRAMREAAERSRARDPRAAIVARVTLVDCERERSVSVHFVGISGIGMSALARILIERGIVVSGSSDRATELTARLASEGARVWIGHDAAHVANAERVVVSSAIAPDNPEVSEATRRGIPIVRRGDLLAELMRERRGIAIGGTHGKTTTTGMVACVLEAGGIDPTVVIGGERVDTGTNARCGRGPWLVTEADESDGSFLALEPEIAVVTNVENDHIASDEELPALVSAFERFLARLPARGLALVGTGPLARELGGRERVARTRTFGLDAAADLRARDIAYEAFGSSFTVDVDGVPLGTFRLNVPGEINVLDALPAIAIGRELGVPPETIARALAGFHGVRRRFEILTRTARAIVVDDYAHHPTAVGATIAAARHAHDGPIVVAFQPHRYSRTHYLAADFASALGAADRVVLTEVYAASEAPIAGAEARSIGDRIRTRGEAVAYASVETLPEYLLEHAPHGALVLMLGAGSITGAARRYADLLGGDAGAGSGVGLEPAHAALGRGRP